MCEKLFVEVILNEVKNPVRMNTRCATQAYGSHGRFAPSE
jgi:hypothetical protein